MPACDPTTSVEYRQIEDVDGYRFGSDGSIQSCWERSGRRSWKTDRWHDLALNLAKGRKYYSVCVRRGGKRVKVDLHPLVCEAWHGPCPPGLECRHIDDNSTNNRPDNLAWGSRLENMADRQKNGIQVQGIRQWKAVFDDDRIRLIRERYAAGGVTYFQLADEYGVSFQTIYCIVKRKTYKHVS